MGVAGLIHGGGFGQLLEALWLAAASLLEAEIVTADGGVLRGECLQASRSVLGHQGRWRRQPRRSDQADAPDPRAARDFRCGHRAIKATSDAAFRRLIARTMRFYAEALFNPHWGEQIAFRPRQQLEHRHGVPGPRPEQAEAIWRPFFAALASQRRGFHDRRRRRRSWPRRRATSGIPASSGSCPGWWSPTIGPARRGQRVLGEQCRGGRTGSARLPIDLAAGRAAASRAAAEAGGRAVSRRRAIGAWRCISTRDWRARRPRRSRRRAIRR